jgi:DNA-binding CsgD family transcriptional regulator
MDADNTTIDDLLRIAEELAGLGAWELRLPGRRRRWSDGMMRLHGLGPDGGELDVEQFLEVVHPEDRERVAGIVAAASENPGSFPPEGVRLDYRVVLPDGSVRTLRALGRADIEPDGTGRWFGVVQDVTEELLTERDLRAHYAVSLALREWESFEEGVMGLLRRMATALEYPLGVLWTLDARRERIVPRATWHAPDLDATEFERGLRRLEFRIGEGLPGHVWQTREPDFVPDIGAERRISDPYRMTALGLRSLLIFPAFTDAGVIAALSFYSTDRREARPRLIRTLNGIGAELGRFLHRSRAQLEPSPLSPRELEVLKLAAEGLSGPKIADRLVVSPSTVKTHFENIYEKLGVGDRAGAVAQALRVGLIS